MKIAVTGETNDYQVWAMLDDSDYNDDPANRGESFVIGEGGTLVEALAAAKAALEKAVGDVEVMLHDAAQNPDVTIEDLVR